MIGTTLAHYEILGKLGSGGMGDVYRARDTRLDREVALKVLPADLAADEERRQRFEREARAVAALNHPNIVTIYSVEEADGVHFFTMELIEGRSLSRMIPADGLPVRDFFRLAIPLVDALRAAHEKGITHRDLKPGNVMITDDGRVKVLDFGLAKLAEPPASAESATELGTAMGSDQLTEAGQIVGTVSYMSPEQAEGKPVDQRSDIFSLGALLYEMATGRQAFVGDTKISIITSILRDEPRPVSEINGALPSHLSGVLGRSLAKQPGDRYASSGDLLVDLDRLKVEVDTEELRRSAVGPAPARRRAGLPGWLAPAAGVAVLLVAGLFLAWLSWPALDRGGLAPDVDAAAGADARPSLAVLYFDNLSGDPSLDWLRTGLTDMLVTDLSQSPHLRVLGTDRLYQILSEMDALEEQMTSFDRVRAVAGEAAVDHVLLGSFARAGDTIRINARLQEAVTGEIVTSEQVQGEGEEAIFPLVDDLTKRIKASFDMPDEMLAADVDRDVDEVTTSSVEAYRRYVEGDRLHEALRDEEAIPLLEQALEHDPDFAMAMAKLSVAHGNEGRIDEARQYAEQAMQHLERLSDRERYYIEGRYYSLAQETVEESIEAYEKAVELYPDHTAARNNLAQQYLGLEQYDEAIEHLEHLRDNRMRFPGTYSSLADAYAALGELDRGYEVLLDYVEENPDNAAGYRNLAELLIWWGRYAEALTAIDQAEGLDPGNPDNDALRWDVAVLQGDWERAEAVTERMLERATGPSGTYQAALAAILLSVHRGDLDAVTDLSEDLVDEFDDGALAVQTRVLVAGMYVNAGNAPRAVELAEEAEELAPDVGTRLNAMATRTVALAAGGLGEDARAELETLWGLVEELNVPYRILRRQESSLRGAVAFRLGEWEEAAEHLQQAVELLAPASRPGNSSHIGTWYLLGASLVELGRPDDAEPWLRQVVESPERLYDPWDHVRGLWYLARIHEERGNRAGARDLYRRFLDHWGDGEIDPARVAHARAFLDG